MPLRKSKRLRRPHPLPRNRIFAQIPRVPSVNSLNDLSHRSRPSAFSMLECHKWKKRTEIGSANTRARRRTASETSLIFGLVAELSSVADCVMASVTRGNPAFALKNGTIASEYMRLLAGSLWTGMEGRAREAHDNSTLKWNIYLNYVYCRCKRQLNHTSARL